MTPDPSDFDFRGELLALFHDAGPDFDKRLKVLALMERVGGFVKKVPQNQTDAAPDGDPIARRVLDSINSKP